MTIWLLGFADRINAMPAGVVLWIVIAFAFLMVSVILWDLAKWCWREKFWLLCLFWWFAVVTSAGQVSLVAPFDNEQNCNDERQRQEKFFREHGDPRVARYVSERCWHGETGYRPGG